jgi:hypothetical protein
VLVCRISARKMLAPLGMLLPRHSEVAMNTDFWIIHREATMNWLALGLLLAAWNAADNRPAPDLRRKPEALRGYCTVSVRAAHRVVAN